MFEQYQHQVISAPLGASHDQPASSIVDEYAATAAQLEGEVSALEVQLARVMKPEFDTQNNVGGSPMPVQSDHRNTLGYIHTQIRRLSDLRSRLEV